MSEPLEPIWHVVHREVLLELLDAALLKACAHDCDVERCDFIEQLVAQLEGGSSDVLTKARWESNKTWGRTVIESHLFK